MKHLRLLAQLAILVIVTACGSKKTTVAVVVDKVTYEKIPAAVDGYVSAITTAEREGVLVIDRWNNPDSIRMHLYSMYQERGLEGAVFIGDIPVPMVRDAQHLTTAFKMNQNKEWIDSSVPSDRFYDDFDLKFKSLGADTTNKLAHYYSLCADSPQMICCDIYSARIKAPEDGQKYEAIEAYLKKASAAHNEREKMDQVLHFGGHGYNSESMNARIDEAIALTEQFPFLNEESGRLDYIDFTFDRFVKKRLMAAVADKSLDLAILHHHGSEDTQYLSGSPLVKDAASWIGLARNYFRSLMRRSKDRAKSAQDIMKRFNVPYSWLSDAFDPEMVKSDSLHSAQMDIYIEDMKGYESGAKVVILDACYNGAFINKDYIASHYLFNGGNTIVVKANSVNTLQDTWTNELMGLMNLGVAVGDWAKGQLTLESHLFGDPTFAFEPQKELYEAVAGDLPRKIVTEKENAGYWKKLLKSNDDSLSPEVKVLAIKMLYNLGEISSQELLQIAQQSKSRIVRLEAFMTNKQIADENLSKAVAIALSDSYELTRRLALITAGKNGDIALIPQIADNLFNPSTTVREYFQSMTAVGIFDAEEMTKALEMAKDKYHNWRADGEYEALIKRVEGTFKRDTASFNDLRKSDVPLKQKRFTISGERNGCSPFAVHPILSVIENCPDKALRIEAAEVLGWYRYSYMKPVILKECKRLMDKVEDPELKNEIEKSINRLQ